MREGGGGPPSQTVAQRRAVGCAMISPGVK
jgi:hypothetical protein